MPQQTLQTLASSLTAHKKKRNEKEFIRTWHAQFSEFKQILEESSAHDVHTDISEFYKPCYLALENIDLFKGTKTALTELRNSIIDVLALCIQKYGHGPDAQLALISALNYTPEKLIDSTTDFISDLLHNLTERYDVTSLTDGLLADISKISLKAEDKVTKVYASLLIAISLKSPKEMNKAMSLLERHVDGESPTIRSAMLEVIGNTISKYLIYDDSPPSRTSLTTDWDILDSRISDTSGYVRAKALQICSMLDEVEIRNPIAGGIDTNTNRKVTAIPREKRHHIVNRAVERLDDKISLVRKNAIRLLTQLVESHTFLSEGGKLNLANYQKALELATEKLREMAPDDLPEDLRQVHSPKPSANRVRTKASKKSKPNRIQQLNSDSETENVEPLAPSSDEEESHTEQETPRSSTTPVPDDPMAWQQAQTIHNYKVYQTYLTDAIRFIRQIERAIPKMLLLITSKTKTDVIEAMRFFTQAYHTGIDSAKEGLKRMVHLIWTKERQDEESRALNVREHLLKMFSTLYLQVDENETALNKAQLIATNLIEQTYDCTLADLTSLEQLLFVMMSKQKEDKDADSQLYFSHLTIQMLWSKFGSRQGVEEHERRGALIILGMLAKADPELLTERIELILAVGFGENGKDDPELSRYACIALQRLASTGSNRIPNSNFIFQKVQEIFDLPALGVEWLPLAEQALGTIYALAERPDAIAATVIKRLHCSAFNASETTSEAGQYNMLALSKLLYVIGQVALKQVIYIEIIETEFKKRKEKESSAAGPASKQITDLQDVVGSVEDDFGDFIAHVKDREILYGDKSLLAKYSPVIIHICLNNIKYKSPLLQICATLALAKFMCVSSRFCEANLQLLLTILIKSPSAIIRSNIIIALGDMAVTFSSLIDDNIGYLYKRLSDRDRTVKKNTLMVLTHLILNGMVKVKGQLSEMAKCLEDPDARIADLSKLFFTELASKENALYNNMPDIISNLSTTGPLEDIQDDENSDHEEDEDNVPRATETTAESQVAAENTSAPSSPKLRGKGQTFQIQVHDASRVQQVNTRQFRSIMRFLFDFIKKDKQSDNLVEKLCQRFRSAGTPRQWADIAFCLTLLPYTSERSIKKLLENLPHFQNALHINTVHKCLQDVIAKARKSLKDGKTLCDELQLQLEVLRQKAQSSHEVSTKAQAALSQIRAPKTAPPAVNTVHPTSKTSRPVRGSKKIVESDSESDGMDVDETPGPHASQISSGMDVDR